MNLILSTVLATTIYRQTVNHLQPYLISYNLVIYRWCVLVYFHFPLFAFFPFYYFRTTNYFIGTWVSIDFVQCVTCIQCKYKQIHDVCVVIFKQTLNISNGFFILVTFSVTMMSDLVCILGNNLFRFSLHIIYCTLR